MIENGEGRPRQGGPSQNTESDVVHSIGITALSPVDRAHLDLDADTLAEVFRYVQRHLVGADVPEFGSPAWCELPPDDPRRHTACVRAATAWWSGVAFGPGLPARVVDRIVAERLADASRSVAAMWPEAHHRHRAHQHALRAREAA